MSNVLYGSQNFSTTLNAAGGIDSSQTTSIVLQSVTGLDTNGGILCFDWAATLDTSKAEYIEYGGISGNTLTGVVRGAEGLSAKAHTNGCTVVAVVSKSHVNRINDKLRGVDATLIYDANGNAIVKTASVASAVNQLTFTNAATGNGPIVSATGSDSNIDLNLTPKGTGKTIFTNPKFTVGSDAQSDIYFRNASGVLARLAAGTSGQFLQTKGSSADPIWAGFLFGNAQPTNDVSVSSSTFADVTGCTTTLALGSGTFTVIAIATLTMDGDTGGDNGQHRIVIGASNGNPTAFKVVANGDTESIVAIHIATSQTGSTVVKSQIARQAGSGNIRAANGLGQLLTIAFPQ